MRQTFHLSKNSDSSCEMMGTTTEIEASEMALQPSSDTAAIILKGAKVLKCFEDGHQIKEDSGYDPLRAESI